MTDENTGAPPPEPEPVEPDPEKVVIPEPVEFDTEPAFPPPAEIGTVPFEDHQEHVPVPDPYPNGGPDVLTATEAEKAEGIVPKSTPDAPDGVPDQN